MKSVFVSAIGAIVCVALAGVVVDGARNNAKPIRDPCRQICNEYKDICLPTWIDPWNSFSPHCEDVRDRGRPGVSCILCLKNHGITPQESRQPGGGSPPFGGGSPPFGGGSPPFGGGSPPFGGGSPPFGGGRPPIGSRPPNGGGQTLGDLLSPGNGFGTTAGTYLEDPIDEYNPNWPTSIFFETTTVEMCPEICTCTRTQTATTEVTTSYCPLTYDEDYECDLDDPSALVTSDDESTCVCEDDPSCTMRRKRALS